MGTDIEDRSAGLATSLEACRLRRRELLLRGGSLLAAGVAAGATTASNGPAFAQSAQQPNIVYIIADDLGWKGVGFHGSDIKTSNLDKLAAAGARLEQFYVQPMCTPTRAALMTGRYPFRYGLQTAVIPASGTYGLALDEYPPATNAQGCGISHRHERKVASRPLEEGVLAAAARI